MTQLLLLTTPSRILRGDDLWHTSTEDGVGGQPPGRTLVAFDQLVRRGLIPIGVRHLNQIWIR